MNMGNIIELKHPQGSTALIMTLAQRHTVASTLCRVFTESVVNRSLMHMSHSQYNSSLISRVDYTAQYISTENTEIHLTSMLL